MIIASNIVRLLCLLEPVDEYAYEVFFSYEVYREALPFRVL